MKNDKNVKQVSRLTGDLLARKGSAAPTQTPLRMNQNAGHFYAARHETEQVTTRASAPKVPAKVDIKINKGKVSSDKAKSSAEVVDGKRIAMTLRMVEEDHLKLRLFSAHTRKSCQTILSEALDVYLAENEDRIPELRMASQNM